MRCCVSSIPNPTPEPGKVIHLPIQGNPVLDRLLAKVDDIAVLPHVVFKVLEIDGDGDLLEAGLERAITTDPGFSAKVLTLANSKAHALPTSVGSVREALLILGFKSVRNLAMAVGAFDMFVGKNDEDSLRRRSWWRHSVDSAACARWLSKRAQVGTPDEAYSCGLLHIMGKTLLERYGEGSYTECSHLIIAGADACDAERDVFGCDHVEVAVGVAQAWGFPESLVQGLRYTEVPNPTDAFAKERAVTALSSAIAQFAMQGKKREELGVPSWSLALLEFPDEIADTIVEEGIAVITAAQLNL
jgi:HD-like signal output (HDOD) protein